MPDTMKVNPSNKPLVKQLNSAGLMTCGKHGKGEGKRKSAYEIQLLELEAKCHSKVSDVDAAGSSKVSVVDVATEALASKHAKADSNKMEPEVMCSVDDVRSSSKKRSRSNSRKRRTKQKQQKQLHKTDRNCNTARDEFDDESNLKQNSSQSEDEIDDSMQTDSWISPVCQILMRSDSEEKHISTTSDKPEVPTKNVYRQLENSFDDDNTSQDQVGVFGFTNQDVTSIPVQKRR